MSDDKQAKKLARGVVAFLKWAKGRTWKQVAAALLALAVAVVLALLHGGCAGMVSKGAVEKPELKVEKGAVPVNAPVNVQPGAVKVGEGGSASASLGAVWDMLKGITTDLSTVKDIVSGIQQRLESQVSQQVTVSQGKGDGLKEALAGVGLLALTGIGLSAYLWIRSRVPMKVATVLSQALETDPDALGVRSAIKDLAPKAGLSEATLERFRRAKGTSPRA